MEQGAVMSEEIRVWGIHMGEHVGARPVEQGYVAIGWTALGDPCQYPDRETLKQIYVPICKADGPGLPLPT